MSNGGNSESVNAEMVPGEPLVQPYEVRVFFAGTRDEGVPKVCYAVAHNRIAFVQSLSVRLIDSSTPSKLTIRIRGEWAANDRSPIKETEIVLDAPVSGAAVELSPVTQIQLSDVALADLEELAPATLVLEINDDLGRRQFVRCEIDVYAREQWLSDPNMAVITAAFVQPNHPDVNRVLTRAAAILQRMGTPGLSGYQDSASGQHHRIAEAVFLALQESVDAYINPPASYEAIGQKLRPIDRVLEEKQGTCIDLACAYATCLEQAGLHPIIFLVRGHAFSGYLTERTQLNASVIKSWPAIQSLIDSKLLVGVETVTLTGSEGFLVAVTATQVHLNSDRMEAVVDISRAHREGVRPLPARVVRDGVITVVVDNGPSSPPAIERRDAATRKLLPESVPGRVQAWKNSLLDLSFRNRLLNLVPERHGLNLLPPVDYLGRIEDHLNNGGSLTVRALDDLTAVQAQIVQRGGAIPLEILQEVLVRMNGIFCAVETKRFKNVITRLKADASLQEEESGANCLYLALGSVIWSDKYASKKGQQYRSPIFLVPVRIRTERGRAAVSIEMDATQSTTVNFCLIEALRVREQLNLQWFSDDMSDELGLDIEAGLEAMRQEFRDRGLDVQGFGVDQTVSLAVLDFKKFRLWKDLNDHWKDFMASPVVRHLVETPRETYPDPAKALLENLKVDDVSTICAQPADGSQIQAIERALAGSSFVLKGPPGSGKSQTITNLLANAMHRGKKVLFVAEKASALQEVQERLEAVKLGPYCLVLHDSGTKPESLRAQLRDALEQTPKLDERLHRNFEDEFANAATQLDTYRKNVYEPNAAGFSFASAYYRLAERGDGPIAAVPRSVVQLSAEKIDELQRGLLGLDDLTRPARVRPQHPWSLAGDVDFEVIERAELAREIKLVLESCDAVASVGPGPLADVLNRAATIAEFKVVADLLDFRERGLLPAPTEWSKLVASEWLSKAMSTLDQLVAVLTGIATVIAGSEDVLTQTTLDSTAASVAEAAKSFAVGRRKRIRQALGPFAGLIDADKVAPDQVVATITSIAFASKQAREITESLRALGGLDAIVKNPPVRGVEVAEIRSRIILLVGLAEMLARSDEFGGALRVVASGSEMPIPGFADKIHDVSHNVASLAKRLRANESTMQRWSAGTGLLAAVRERSRETWREALETGTFLSLQRWLGLRKALVPYREIGMHEFCESIEEGQIAASDAPLAFERGLLVTTLQVRAEETDLDVFDSVQHNRRVRRFVELLDERRRRAQAVIPYYLYQKRTIASGVTTGKVGDFRREVNTPTRKRRGRSIRHLIERYPDIISDLTPCFLMSPDSVAQFIPPGTLKFDILVFDEASQIVVADAIGAMGRSNSCVIVGDREQMPPTRVGVANTADEEVSELQSDEAVIDEEESILDEAIQAGFEEIKLTWHYRSQDESLIAFSNERYYDRELSTFPGPVAFRPDCGVFYRRVDGQFDHGSKRTNEVEAYAIMEELTKRLDDPATAGLTYGIVTMNLNQKNLITDLVFQSTHPGVVAIRDLEDKKRKLFVLNLENVQGRERDVIILGTAFSRRHGGGAMPLNFGPLTGRNGEKRLNVAVTRAKRQMVIVSSFDPEELAAAKPLGMVHLREYLTAAKKRSEVAIASVKEEPPAEPHIDLIVRKLRERGIRVEVKRGLSKFKVDLALTLPEFGDEYLVAVLFDSEEWSERPLVTDRDALPLIILENVMGWRRVARVWMPSIRLELDAVIDELIEHVHVAKDMPKVDTMAAAPTPDEILSSGDSEIEVPTPAATPLATSEATRDVLLPNEKLFVSHRFPHVPYDQSALMTTYAQGLLGDLIDTEGPMLAFDALKRVAREFGVQRVSGNRLNELTALLSTRLVVETLGEYYAWPTSLDPATWRGFRRSSNDVRKVETICPHEIINAMEVTVRRSITISPEELVKWTGQFFGAGRVTARLGEFLDECVKEAVRTRRFVLVGGQLTCA